MSKTRAGRPLRHQLTKAIPVTQCATCHNGGSRAAMNLRGMMEAPPVGKETRSRPTAGAHGGGRTAPTPAAPAEVALIVPMRLDSPTSVLRLEQSREGDAHPWDTCLGTARSAAVCRQL